MDFTNSFTVKVPLQTVWEYLLDAQKVTPCVPGAELTETVDERHYKGTVKVKLGAVQMSYRGELEMEPDEATRTIVLHAKGTEVRGSGGATGTVTTRLTQDAGGSTTIEMESHVDVTGRVAQFGRGIMQDVANRLVKDFARCLETQITAEQTRQTSESGNDGAATGDAHDSPTSQSSRPKQGADTETGSMAQTAAAPTRPSLPATEIRPLPLLADVARSRAASLLRKIASRIEPR